MSKNVMIKRLSRVYGQPENADPIAFIAEYSKALEGFSDEVLGMATDRLLRTRKYKSWPSIAECLGSLKTVESERKTIEQMVKSAGLGRTGRTKDREPLDKLTIDKILRDNSRMTQRACEEGWIVGLHDFIRDRHNIPNPEQRDVLRSASNFVLRASTGVENLGVLHAGLLQLAKAMVKRREKLTRELSQ